MGEVATRQEHQIETAQVITPMEMIQIAIEKGADIDQLAKLMDLQERHEANEAKKAYVRAVAAFKAEAPALGKNKHVRFDTKNNGVTEYDHATLDSITAAVNPVLSKNGLSYRWETKQDNGMICVACVLTHDLGHSERNSLSGPSDQSGGKNNIQAIGSTVSYLQRYTLLAILGLATKDQDSDGLVIEYIDKGHIAVLEGLIEDTGTDLSRFLAAAHADSLDEIMVGQFDKLKAQLEQKKAQKNAGA